LVFKTDALFTSSFLAFSTTEFRAYFLKVSADSSFLPMTVFSEFSFSSRVLWAFSLFSSTFLAFSTLVLRAYVLNVSAVSSLVSMTVFKLVSFTINSFLVFKTDALFSSTFLAFSTTEFKA